MAVPLIYADFSSVEEWAVVMASKRPEVQFCFSFTIKNFNKKTI